VLADTILWENMKEMIICGAGTKDQFAVMPPDDDDSRVFSDRLRW
jgi:hypothetical protein